MIMAKIKITTGVNIAILIIILLFLTKKIMLVSTSIIFYY